MYIRENHLHESEYSRESFARKYISTKFHMLADRWRWKDFCVQIRMPINKMYFSLPHTKVFHRQICKHFQNFKNIRILSFQIFKNFQIFRNFLSIQKFLNVQTFLNFQNFSNVFKFSTIFEFSEIFRFSNCQVFIHASVSPRKICEHFQICKNIRILSSKISECS